MRGLQVTRKAEGGKQKAEGGTSTTLSSQKQKAILCVLCEILCVPLW